MKPSCVSHPNFLYTVQGMHQSKIKGTGDCSLTQAHLPMESLVKPKNARVNEDRLGRARGGCSITKANLGHPQEESLGCEAVLGLCG